MRALSARQLRFDPLLDAHSITCARCRRVAIVERGDRTQVLLALAALGDAGWRRFGSEARCVDCRPQPRPEPRTHRPSVPYDPSIARTALRAYAYQSTGETRRWALTLLREWGG